MMRPGLPALLVVLGLTAACRPTAEPPSADAVLGDIVGAVDFPASCTAAAAAGVERGVALLHHMMYSVAREGFEQAAAADPDCALAPWGVAMTYIHPLWSDRPTPDILAIGAELVARARTIGGATDRETAYIETVGAYFDGEAERTEAERLVDFEAAWQRLHLAHPDDLEGKAFFALAHLALADPDDRSLTVQRMAGAIAEEIYAAVPDHPGAHHYIIHSYDYPGLAEKALPVARNYGHVAPAVPHALHMMTHIFTRLGLWDESIEWNRKSADAALQLSGALGAVSMHYQHALDYLAYAYLQKGLDDPAREIVGLAASLRPPFHQVNRHAAAFAFSAIPARYALERHDWAAAATLEPRTPAAFPWEEAHQQFVAMSHFARALGLAHEGRYDRADAEIAVLREIETSVAPHSEYWAKQIEIQRRAATAWRLYLGGDAVGGLEAMQAAAALEATTEKAPITPGELLPAMELLGDMLRYEERFDEAIAAYQATLARRPGRFNSLFGAGRAAESNGDRQRAAAFYRRLIRNTAGAGDSRPALAHARRF